MGKILKTAGALYFISNSIISFILGVIAMYQINNDDYFFVILLIILVSVINFGVKFVFLSTFGELVNMHENTVDKKIQLEPTKLK